MKAIANFWDSLQHTVYNKSEQIVGTISGGTLGYIAHRTFSDILVSLGVALLTGFVGALGAHLFKLAKAKLSSLKKR